MQSTNTIKIDFKSIAIASAEHAVPEVFGHFFPQNEKQDGRPAPAYFPLSNFAKSIL